jgi:hypothetical protein
MGDTDRIERDIVAMEKEIRSLKTKLDNSVIDIRAVNFYGWVHPQQDGFCVPAKPEKYWTVVRHEIQYKRQGSPEWVPIPTINRDLDDSKYTVIPLPTGELEE